MPDIELTPRPLDHDQLVVTGFDADALRSQLLQISGRVLLGGLFVVSEVLVHLHLTAGTMWAYASSARVRDANGPKEPSC